MSVTSPITMTQISADITSTSGRNLPAEAPDKIRTIRIKNHSYGPEREAHGLMLVLNRLGSIPFEPIENLKTIASHMGLMHEGFTEESWLITIPATRNSSGDDTAVKMLREAGFTVQPEDAMCTVTGVCTYTVYLPTQVPGSDDWFTFLYQSRTNTLLIEADPNSEAHYEVYELSLQFE